MNPRSRVYIVGAGSGSPGYLTLEAVDVLRRADVVVYDRLIPARVLDYARPDAVKVYVGKAPGRHSKSQDEINRILLGYATEGKTVVRLKGGDPLFFGRGEEECMFLLRHGVPCKVLPGIASPFAAAARFLIPLAGRGFSSSVAFATGVTAGGAPLPRERIRALLASADTVVFLMATRIYEEIIEAVLEMRGDREAVAVIEDLGGRERIALGEASDPRIRKHTPRPPALIIVGGAARWAMEREERSGYSW